VKKKGENKLELLGKIVTIYGQTQTEDEYKKDIV
jgi:hypothetical protein